MAKEQKVQEQPRVRRWLTPNKRLKGYGEELKAGVHMRGPKEGKPLTPIERGVRIGAFQTQNDHIGQWKYSKARNEGKSKEEAKRYSQEIGSKK